MKLSVLFSLLLVVGTSCAKISSAFVLPLPPTPRVVTHHHHHHHKLTTPSVLKAARFLTEEEDKNGKNQGDTTTLREPLNRRQWMLQSLVLTTATTTPALLATATPLPAHALVKGVAPPPPKGSKTGDKPKCTNVEECQALAEKRQQEEAEAAAAAAEPAQTTAGGTKYRDLQAGAGRTAKAGDQVTLQYKVLKLGKRSFDGLSGEGTVVFSRGYGLEDDEKVPGDKSFITILGSPLNVAALNEAVEGMQPGGVRRFSVFPSKGWRKPGAACDGGPGGSGAGGELRTDYVVVPTATMVQEETCFDMTKQPFPFSYAEQRRMAQRFDQSLIMEVTLVDVADGF